jgi:Na+/phosphate symporter
MSRIVENKNLLKKNRRLETKAMQRMEQQMAFERSTWYYLSSTSSQQMLNTLARIAEPIKEHMEHSFTPLPRDYSDEFAPYCRDIYNVLSDIDTVITSGDYSGSASVSERAKALKHSLASLRKEHIMRIHGKQGSLRVELVYLNLIQESHELLSEVRNLLRGCNKYYL